MKTAEEFFHLKYLERYNNVKEGELYPLSPTTESIKDAIEFTKLHCKAQLKAILKKARIKHSGPYFYKEDITFVNLKCIKVDKDSITNAYDLNQIK